MPEIYQNETIEEYPIPELHYHDGINFPRIRAREIECDNLSSITADIGTITTGTMTGVTIQTAASGRRTVMTSDGINLYDQAGELRGYINTPDNEDGYSEVFAKALRVAGSGGADNTGRILIGNSSDDTSGLWKIERKNATYELDINMQGGGTGAGWFETGAMSINGNVGSGGIPVLQIDSISEKTLANGVIIDGLNIRDGKLNTNASVPPSALATGATTAGVATYQTTNSTSYTDLATSGPAVTVTIGANGLALVIISTSLLNTVTSSYSYMSFAVSGASTVAAADTSSLFYQAFGGEAAHRTSYVKLLTGLTAGSTTFTAKYKASADVAGFANREISVIPL